MLLVRPMAEQAFFHHAVHGIVDLVWLPWQQYQEDGRMFRGLQRGANSFTSSTGSASLELASRLVAAVEVGVCVCSGKQYTTHAATVHFHV